jgi:hypothetical protein
VSQIGIGRFRTSFGYWRNGKRGYWQRRGKPVTYRPTAPICQPMDLRLADNIKIATSRLIRGGRTRRYWLKSPIPLRLTRAVGLSLRGNDSRKSEDSAMVTVHNGSEIKLHLLKLGAKRWTGRCVVIDPAGTEVTLDETTEFATKEEAGQAAFTAACAYIDSEPVKPKARKKRSASA